MLFLEPWRLWKVIYCAPSHIGLYCSSVLLIFYGFLQLLQSWQNYPNNARKCVLLLCVTSFLEVYIYGNLNGNISCLLIGKNSAFIDQAFSLAFGWNIKKKKNFLIKLFSPVQSLLCNIDEKFLPCLLFGVSDIVSCLCLWATFLFLIP